MFALPKCEICSRPQGFVTMRKCVECKKQICVHCCKDMNWSFLNDSVFVGLKVLCNSCAESSRTVANTQPQVSDITGTEANNVELEKWLSDFRISNVYDVKKNIAANVDTKALVIPVDSPNFEVFLNIGNNIRIGLAIDDVFEPRVQSDWIPVYAPDNITRLYLHLMFSYRPSKCIRSSSSTSRLRSLSSSRLSFSGDTSPNANLTEGEYLYRFPVCLPVLCPSLSGEGKHQSILESECTLSSSGSHLLSTNNNSNSLNPKESFYSEVLESEDSSLPSSMHRRSLSVPSDASDLLSDLVEPFSRPKRWARIPKGYSISRNASLVSSSLGDGYLGTRVSSESPSRCDLTSMDECMSEVGQVSSTLSTSSSSAASNTNPKASKSSGTSDSSSIGSSSNGGASAEGPDHAHIVYLKIVVGLSVGVLVTWILKYGMVHMHDLFPLLMLIAIGVIVRWCYYEIFYVFDHIKKSDSVTKMLMKSLKHSTHPKTTALSKDEDDAFSQSSSRSLGKKRGSLTEYPKWSYGTSHLLTGPYKPISPLKTIPSVSMSGHEVDVSDASLQVEGTKGSSGNVVTHSSAVSSSQAPAPSSSSTTVAATVSSSSTSSVQPSTTTSTSSHPVYERGESFRLVQLSSSKSDWIIRAVSENQKGNEPNEGETEVTVDVDDGESSSNEAMDGLLGQLAIHLVGISYTLPFKRSVRCTTDNPSTSVRPTLASHLSMVSMMQSLLNLGPQPQNSLNTMNEVLSMDTSSLSTNSNVGDDGKKFFYLRIRARSNSK